MFETAFNQYLALDPEAPEKLNAFDGKLICIEIRGPNKNIYLAVSGNRVTIIGSPAALFKLGVHRDAAPLFFAGEVEIRGDTRLGREFKSLLAEMEIDWEEHLSRLIGDIAAHRLAGIVNDLRQWGNTAASNFADDVGEYLQEESRDVVSEAEMGMFYQQVDKLRDDTDRLIARADRLTGSNR